MLQHGCRSKRISWPWIFWHFSCAPQCMMRSNTEMGAKKDYCICMKMLSVLFLSTQWDPWPADSPRNYAYLQLIYVPPMQVISHFSLHTCVSAVFFFLIPAEDVVVISYVFVEKPTFMAHNDESCSIITKLYLNLNVVFVKYVLAIFKLWIHIKHKYKHSYIWCKVGPDDLLDHGILDRVAKSANKYIISH